MKTILFLLSFMFVSCVTANPESRDLSAVNTAEDENIKTAFNWKFKKWKKDDRSLTYCYSECEKRDKQRLNDPCYNDISREHKLNNCYTICNYSFSQKEGVKVASIGDQNPFNLLKEAQGGFFNQPTTHNEKTSLRLAGYGECVDACVADGHCEDDCRRACK